MRGIQRSLVPHTSLSCRVNKKVSMKARVGHPTSLSTTEEDSLINYDMMSERGFPPSREDVIHYAWSIDLQRPEEQRCLKDTGPSLTWWKRFRDRHPDLSIKTAQSVDKAAINNTGNDTLNKYFDLLEKTINDNNGIWKGRVVVTLRNLYTKTDFRVKRNSKLSPMIHNDMGVNQGGVASGFLFQKYMSDLKQYLDCNVGVCISKTILVHLLWADDLILFSDTPNGLQRQLNGLYTFCANNHMIVNEAKSKVMYFGKQPQFCVSFNHKEIEQVDRYKYLSNIIRRVDRHQQDIFADNYKYLCEQARKAIFCVKRKIQNIGALPPHVMFYIFETMIRPITTSGSDVWGFRFKNISCIDKEFLEFSKRILRVKTTTCNAIVYGECGHLPPSVFCHINALFFVHRLFKDIACRHISQVGIY